MPVQKYRIWNTTSTEIDLKSLTIRTQKLTDNMIYSALQFLK